MSDFSLQALNVAIGSIAFEREALMLRIKSVSPEVEDEEQLSEQVLLIDQTLGEFHDEYDALRGDSTTYPPFETVIAEGARSARAAFKVE